MTQPMLLTVAEFAARVKYDVRTIRERLIGDGKLIHNHHWYRLGARSIRIDFSAICADMGLPHANYTDDDMLTPEDIAKELKIDVRTLREHWLKGPILKPGVHFARLPYPDCRHIICIRPAILQAFGVMSRELAPDDTPAPPAPEVQRSVSPILLHEQDRHESSQLSIARLPTVTATDYFEVAAERWRDEETALLTPRTRVKAVGYLDTDLMPWFRGYTVSEITRPYILDALGQVEKARGRSYAHACFHVLKQIFDVAERLWASPSPLRSLFELPRAVRQPRVFSLQECQRLIKATPAEWLAYIVTRLFTGLTNEEAHSLRWNNVTLDARALHVREEYLSGQWVPVDPKVRRTIPLSNLVVSALIDHRARSVASDGMNLVFHQRNLQPLSTAAVTRTLWDPLLSHVGIQPMQLREVRNTAAYLWLVAGESPDDVADWFGYGTDVNRLLNRYGPLASPVQDMTPLDRLFSAQDAKRMPRHP